MSPPAHLPSGPPAVLEWDGHSAVITMMRPRQRNCLDAEMLGALSNAFDAAARARVVILRAGADMPVWCAGFDIAALAPGFDPLAQNGLLQGLFRQVRDHAGIVIAMLNGSTWGGGTDLALRCDLAIADPTCTLAFTPARLGLPYDADGLLNVVMRAGPAVALEMFGTGDPVAADRALRLGLVNHVVPRAELQDFTMAMARRIASNAPLSVASAKQQIRAIAAALPLPAALSQQLQEGRRRALDSVDYAEGLAAFRAKRQPTFEGR